MTLLQLTVDGALAAAQLLALLFVPPAAAREPAALDGPAALERPVQLHRLSTSADARLLGSLADVRVAQAAPAERDTPRAMLLEDDDGHFLLIVPHRAAPRGTLVLRPSSGDPETLQLGAIDVRHAVFVRLEGGAHLDRLADGAVELELADDRRTWWTTLVAERIGQRPPLQTRSAQ